MTGRDRPTPAPQHQRVFDIDIPHCPNCGGVLKLIAAIEEPAVILSTLAHLGLPAPCPPRALALFPAASSAR